MRWLRACIGLCYIIKMQPVSTIKCGGANNIFVERPSSSSVVYAKYAHEGCWQAVEYIVHGWDGQLPMCSDKCCMGGCLPGSPATTALQLSSMTNYPSTCVVAYYEEVLKATSNGWIVRRSVGRCCCWSSSVPWA